MLVLGTLWSAHRDALTREDTGHPQARKILDSAATIEVPAAFTGRELQDLGRAAAGDVRLAEAAAGARDGQVTQYLAGVPELMARYELAPPAAWALIHAAMDARRLGHSLALPHALLAAAAPAYMTDAEWDDAGEDWLEQALAYTAPCRYPAITRPPLPNCLASCGTAGSITARPVLTCCRAARICSALASLVR